MYSLGIMVIMAIMAMFLMVLIVIIVIIVNMILIVIIVHVVIMVTTGKIVIMVVKMVINIIMIIYKKLNKSSCSPPAVLDGPLGLSPRLGGLSDVHHEEGVRPRGGLVSLGGSG